MTRRRDVTKYANEDTPSKIKVPDNTYGLFLWALGRFGVAVVFAFAAYLFYQDQRADQEINRKMVEKMMESREEDRKVTSSLINAIDKLTDMVESQSQN